jgi:surfeit locus 1 family protein
MSDGQAVPRRGRLSAFLALVLGLAAFAVLILLGTWQVQRLQWKERLIADIESRVHTEPVPLDDALARIKPIPEAEYAPVTVEGTFRHESERHFFATHNGASGYFVYTPMLRDEGDWVFVNRGFVPYDVKDAAKRRQGQVAGHVSVTGLLREALHVKPSSLVPENDPAKNIFYWKDIRAMAASSGLPSDASVLDVFVDADDTPNAGGLPVGGVTIVDLPNNHLQYAVTWYGLAAALVAVLGAWLWRNFRR